MTSVLIHRPISSLLSFCRLIPPWKLSVPNWKVSRTSHRVGVFSSNSIRSFLFFCADASIQTHFDMTNPNDWVLAYSFIKQSVVQLERTSDEDLSRLANANRHPNFSGSSPNSTMHDDLPRVRGPKSTRFTCPICGLITVSMERLQRHVNQHGQKLRLETYKPERKVSTLICEKCKATFSSAYALRKHQRVHTRGSVAFPVRRISFFRASSRQAILMRFLRIEVLTMGQPSASYSTTSRHQSLCLSLLQEDIHCPL